MSALVESVVTETSFAKGLSEKVEYPRYHSDNGSVDLEAQATKGGRFAPIRYTLLNIYRRLFTIVVMANVAVFIAIMVSDRKLVALVNAAAGNLLACGLARQPLVVNSIFVVVCAIPRSAPLRIRRLAAKVYHYGGVHSGCGIASFIWYVGFVGVLSREYWAPPSGEAVVSMAPIILAYAILVLLLAIIVVAHPKFRSKLHDYFELTHRFSGWLVVALFVVLLMIFADEASETANEPLGRFLIKLPAFWFLMVTVVAIIHPWVLLRKVKVQPEYLSPHAVRLHLDHTTTNFGKGIQLSRHPLQDWHGFATFPDPEGKSFSCLVSKAGDWTSACIKDQPTHLYKRGVLVYGVAYAMRVFKRVVVVTTGSGIGPCLSFLGDDNRPDLRVVWQTRAPLKTYGQEILNLVSVMDANPVVIDTNQSGRVDMVPIIRQIVRDFDAEAVCVISNPSMTKRVVFELESRGIPAFGPIFDS
ncbi:integral membrane protein TmpA [Aspergillus ellipticus CBS 707.79]|uniref:Integral membrane protein TmpA n=1 Tax=Aspergillus ellipticus CBS 707.79 TaxID=1448320 RepID=A0A319D8U8_9EURO|nr:integral membrane protein TmpA [Aspergillus ellipticus CBS 707.79]